MLYSSSRDTVESPSVPAAARLSGRLAVKAGPYFEPG